MDDPKGAREFARKRDNAMTRKERQKMQVEHRASWAALMMTDCDSVVLGFNECSQCWENTDD